MNSSDTLRLAIPALLWIAAGVMVWYGMWIPMAVLLGVSVLVILAFALPGLLAQRKRSGPDS